jgi:hypothetical protein
MQCELRSLRAVEAGQWEIASVRPSVVFAFHPILRLAGTTLRNSPNPVAIILRSGVIYTHAIANLKRTGAAGSLLRIAHAHMVSRVGERAGLPTVAPRTAYLPTCYGVPAGGSGAWAAGCAWALQVLARSR